jgi:signal transduction histidine kinase
MSPCFINGRPAPQLQPAPLAVIELAGPEHRVRFVNDAFCRLAGEEREALLGRRFVELVGNGEICAPLLNQVYEIGGTDEGPQSLASGESAPYWIHALWPERDPKAPPAGVVIRMARFADAHRDIAEMNEALLVGALRQHELREASETANATLEAAVAERTAQLRDSLAQIEAFSYSLAHDLRAPVRAIQGFVQLALELPGSDAWAGADLLRRVVVAAARMEKLIQDVLNLNRVASQAITLGPIDVDALVRTLAAERPELAPEKAELRVDGPLPPMLGHEQTLRQCLDNLLDNATKFVAPGERPRIRVWAERRLIEPGPAKGAAAASGAPARPTKTKRHAAAVVRLWVEDEGIGIDAKHREKIFEIFERLPTATRYPGTGIGLAIVRQGIHRMGGSVGVEPGEPRGSRFWLQLPAG